MQSHVLFVGERRSQTAVARGWRWKDGHLAAKQLFDAFKEVQFEKHRAEFCNVFEDGKHGRGHIIRAILSGKPVIAMGKKVQAELSRWEIPFVPMVHPAARGKIRSKRRYAAEVRRAINKTGADWL